MFFSKGMKVPELVPPMRESPKLGTDTRAEKSMGTKA